MSNKDELVRIVSLARDEIISEHTERLKSYFKQILEQEDYHRTQLITLQKTKAEAEAEFEETGTVRAAFDFTRRK